MTASLLWQHFKDTHFLQAQDLIVRSGRTQKKSELLAQASLPSQSQALRGEEATLRLEMGTSVHIYPRTTSPDSRGLQSSKRPLPVRQRHPTHTLENYTAVLNKTSTYKTMPALQRTCPHLPSWLPDQNWGQISITQLGPAGPAKRGGGYYAKDTWDQANTCTGGNWKCA